MEMANNDKHINLHFYNINYDHKKFYSNNAYIYYNHIKVKSTSPWILITTVKRFMLQALDINYDRIFLQFRPLMSVSGPVV